MSDYDFKTTSFEFKGFRDLYKLLDGMPEHLKAKSLEPALLAAVEPIRAYAEVMAPDDMKTPDPDLESSIVKSTRQRSGPARSDRALGRFDARAYVGPAGNANAYPQAIMQEFGTVHHVAQPYMRPAWDSEKGTALKLLQERFADHLRKIIARYKLG